MKSKDGKYHDELLNIIQSSLMHIQKDIKKQIDNFYSNPAYKTYKGIRNDKGYTKWKTDVISRFKNQCCICFSSTNLVSHHLYSYKYYPEIRTNINNGVCLCEQCHINFNDLYTNVNTLEQFIEFRRKFKGKNHNIVQEEVKLSKRITIIAKSVVKDKDESPITAPKEKLRINKIISDFEEVKQNLFIEAQNLEKTYKYEKGITIKFRNKETTSLSAIRKLWKEITRINTLINCNKLNNKNVMAKKFHMPLNEFLERIENPNEYLNFTDSEITHLNKILNEDY